MAIGQGDLLVNPLQIAVMVATVANGGTIYQPQFVDRIGLIGEEPSVAFEPVVLSHANIAPETLEVIRESMHRVTTDPVYGTAEYRLGNLEIPVAGKTGTATVSGIGRPIAWFAGFAPYDDPEIAIVVMIENGGQGSGVAAPIFRRIIEKYYGLPVLSYPHDWGEPDIFDFGDDEYVGE
jgi:penicillin-binding protein 2